MGLSKHSVSVGNKFLNKVKGKTKKKKLSKKEAREAKEKEVLEKIRMHKESLDYKPSKNEMTRLKKYGLVHYLDSPLRLIQRLKNANGKTFHKLASWLQNLNLRQMLYYQKHGTELQKNEIETFRKTIYRKSDRYNEK